MKTKKQTKKNINANIDLINNDIIYTTQHPLYKDYQYFNNMYNTKIFQILFIGHILTWSIIPLIIFIINLIKK